MEQLMLTARADMAESMRARWFYVYSLVFGGLVLLLLLFGVTDSRVMGFTGLSRFLVTYIQISMAILPVLVLVTTVRSVVGDREAGVFEYLLSLPVGLGAWYWGKVIGRFAMIFSPALIAMVIGMGWGAIRGAPVPWGLFGFYGLLLFCLTFCFLGLGMLISSMTSSSDLAQGISFAVWLVLLLFIDLILIGVMIQDGFSPESVVMISLVNPLQVFRVAAMMLFDPELVMLGPSAYVIIDSFGRGGYMAWALGYPLLLGGSTAVLGYRAFCRGDLP